MLPKNKKLKIVFFTTDFPPTIGGISEFTRSLAYHMAESFDAEHVYVVALKNQKKGTEKPNEKLTIIRDDTQSLFSLFVGVLNSMVIALTYRMLTIRTTIKTKLVLYI